MRLLGKTIYERSLIPSWIGNHLKEACRVHFSDRVVQLLPVSKLFSATQLLTAGSSNPGSDADALHAVQEHLRMGSIVLCANSRCGKHGHGHCRHVRTMIAMMHMDNDADASITMSTTTIAHPIPHPRP